MLRSDQHPKGASGLRPQDQARVDTDTLLACRAADWAEHSLSTGSTLTVIENPRRSLLWALPEQQRLQEHEAWQSVDYDACCFQGARRKAQTLRSNTDLLAPLACQCSHLRGADEWRRTGAFATEEEKEYTAHFAYALAACITAWAVQRGGLPFAIPRAPPPSPAGSRQRWAEMAYQATREWAMVAEGVRLCLAPPEERPGPWYPRFATADNIACRGTPDCEFSSNNVPDRVELTPSRPKLHKDLYIGRGESFPPYTVKSKWHNPFKVKRVGLTAALKRYRAHIEKSPLLHQLRELSGRTLLCTCPGGQPCHGDVLIRLYQKYWASRPSVYIGSGSRAHKQKTVWASPFLPGDKFTHAECAVQCRSWLAAPEQSWLRE